MPSTEQFQRSGKDPLLKQAETVFSHRQARALVIDRDVLGEPGWDLLLYAYIAQRKGVVCSLNAAAKAIDLTEYTTKRWIDLLAVRGHLVQKDDFFAIGEETETKLTALFKMQISTTLDTVRSFQEMGNNANQRLR